MVKEITQHGTCVLVGGKAVLLRGPSGIGKSSTAMRLLLEPSESKSDFCRLVADDRVQVQISHGRIIASPPTRLAGLLEIRGVGIYKLPFEPRAQIGLVVDLMTARELANHSQRLPERASLSTEMKGVLVPFLCVGASDPTVAIRIRFAMKQLGNCVDNFLPGLAETDKLVLSS